MMAGTQPEIAHEDAPPPYTKNDDGTTRLVAASLSTLGQEQDRQGRADIGRREVLAVTSGGEVE